MIALFFFAITCASASTPNPAVAKLDKIGLDISGVKCASTAFSEGQGQQLSFMETTFDCGDFIAQLEVSYPLHPETMAEEVKGEVAKVHEVYGAQKNPYTGYVSQTSACPQKENLWAEKFKAQPLLIGRLNERGVWGACGKSQEDFWGAIAFIEGKEAFAKVRLTGKKRQSKSKFNSAAVAFLNTVRAKR